MSDEVDLGAPQMQNASGGKLDDQERRRRLREIQLPNERKIIKHPDFEIAWPERVTVVGFVVIFVVCVLVILGTWLLGRFLS